MRFSELWMHQRDLSVCAELTSFQSVTLTPAERNQWVRMLFFLHQLLPLDNHDLLCHRGT